LLTGNIYVANFRLGNGGGEGGHRRYSGNGETGGEIVTAHVYHVLGYLFFLFVVVRLAFALFILLFLIEFVRAAIPFDTPYAGQGRDTLDRVERTGKQRHGAAPTQMMHDK
jgi:hypothetical protein